MKRLIFLALCCLLGAAAQAQSNLTVSIQYTPGAASYAGGATNVSSMVGTCVTAINNSYSAQGIGASPTNPIVVGAVVGAAAHPMSNESTAVQFGWVQQTYSALLPRKIAGAPIAIVVSASAGDYGTVPSAAPTNAWNAVGAVNIMGAGTSTFCGQLEGAISTAMGATKAKGVAKRIRLLPYELGGMSTGVACFHTKDTDPTKDTDTWQQVPYYNNVDSYGRETTSATRGEDPEQVCKNFLTVFSPPAYDPGETYVFHGTVPYGCSFYHAPPPTPGTWNGDVGPIVSITPPGGSTTLTCSGTEVVLNAYSHTGIAYYWSGGFGHYFPAGDPSHDNVAAMSSNFYTVAGSGGTGGYPAMLPGMLGAAEAAPGRIVKR